MDTKHVRAALAVARHRSFTQAARELFVDQSTLSRQVGALERELGALLFVRGIRSVSLTSAGEAFVPRAVAILRAVEDATEAVRTVSGARHISDTTCGAVVRRLQERDQPVS